MPPYVFVEFPKMVMGRIAQNAEEERAFFAEIAPASAVDTVVPALPATAHVNDSYSVRTTNTETCFRHSPSATAIRMQRSRARRKQGCRSIRIDLSDTQIDTLITRGFLDGRRRDDVEELARISHTDE